MQLRANKPLRRWSRFGAYLGLAVTAFHGVKLAWTLQRQARKYYTLRQYEAAEQEGFGLDSDSESEEEEEVEEEELEKPVYFGPLTFDQYVSSLRPAGEVREQAVFGPLNFADYVASLRPIPILGAEDETGGKGSGGKAAKGPGGPTGVRRGTESEVDGKERASPTQQEAAGRSLKMKLEIRYSRLARLRFGGTPKPTEVNKRAVHSFLTRRMGTDGVRFKDIVRVIDRAVAMTFVPDESEIDAAELATSWIARYRRYRLGLSSFKQE
jgi:hypothetical protein